jgi:hypothetical protein
MQSQIHPAPRWARRGGSPVNSSGYMRCDNAISAETSWRNARYIGGTPTGRRVVGSWTDAVPSRSAPLKDPGAPEIAWAGQARRTNTESRRASGEEVPGIRGPRGRLPSRCPERGPVVAVLGYDEPRRESGDQSLESAAAFERVQGGRMPRRGRWRGQEGKGACGGPSRTQAGWSVHKEMIAGSRWKENSEIAGVRICQDTGIPPLPRRRFPMTWSPAQSSIPHHSLVTSRR